MANWSKNNNFSSFWLDDYTSNTDVLTGEKISNSKDYIKMASRLKAIGNFVKIVSGNDVKVQYNNRDESYTDGKTVTISSKINGKSFDSTVGLALHEGSHVKLSDFHLLQNILGYNGKEYLQKQFGFEITTEMESKGLYLGILKDLINIIEDRRIDYNIFTTAPGYQGYYNALYDRYFHAKVIDKALISGEHREETIESYFFRICNMTNSNRDLSALKGLREIYSIINLNDIARLKNTNDAVTTAIEVFKVLDKHIPLPPKEDGEGNCDTPGENKTDEESNCSGGSGKSSENCNTPEGESDDDGSTTTGEDINCKDDESLLPELSPKDKNQLRKAIQKQKDFIRNNIKKSSIRKAEKQKIDAINNSKASYEKVGEGIGNGWYKSSNGVQCLVVRNINKSVIDSQAFETLNSREWAQTHNQEAIDLGIKLGTQLGKKLQVRNDSNELKYNRLNAGRIDKRMIASAGFGNENIFQQVFIDNHKDANVHISIDASGSMSGSKWDKSITSAVAIAKAASMVGNLNITISFRSTEQQGKKYLPAIFIAYDSKVDKIKKIQTLFKHITCPGTTPEGLCFEAIQNEIISSSNQLDSYFINFSDGEPYFESKDISYWGDDAAKHTAKQVKSFREKGIKVLSYFITGSFDKETSTSFKTMYGPDAQNVNVNNLAQLTKTLNNMFIEK